MVKVIILFKTIEKGKKKGKKVELIVENNSNIKLLSNENNHAAKTHPVH